MLGRVVSLVAALLLGLALGLAAGWVAFQTPAGDGTGAPPTENDSVASPRPDRDSDVGGGSDEREEHVRGEPSADSETASDTTIHTSSDRRRIGGAQPSRRRTAPSSNTAADASSDMRDLIRRHYIRIASESPDERLLDRAEASAARALEHGRLQWEGMPAQTALNEARRIHAFQVKRVRYGELIGDVDIHMQVRGPSSNNVTPAGPANEADADYSGLNTDTPVNRRESTVYRIQGGGIIPPGQSLVIERIELSYVGPAQTYSNAKVEASAGAFDAESGPLSSVRREVVYEGLAIVGSGREDTIRLATNYAAASFRVQGRIVEAADARALKRVPLRVVADETTGFVQKFPIRLQLLADHGGGNPRKLYFDGSTNHRIDGVGDRDLMLVPGEDLSKLDDSLSRAAGAGPIPPGMAARITTIIWRSRLHPNAELKIYHERKDLVLVDKLAKDKEWRRGPKDERRAAERAGTEYAGRWVGDIIVQGGKEQDFVIELDYFGVVDVEVYGELIDKP